MAVTRKENLKLSAVKKVFAYTTGTYAAAAAKAAAYVLLGGKDPTEIEQTLPNGERALIAINKIEKTGNSAGCGVVKKSVDKKDATHNLEIFAMVSFRDDDKIVIDGGVGIGRITKNGLQLPIGEAAINPAPRKMICSSLRELTGRGVDVVISSPMGKEIADLTYNPRLGIVGGISIIGTTGIMKQKSAISFKKTILQQINFCRENGIKEIIITPGNIGEEAMLENFGDRICKEQIVQSGDFLGFTLRRAYTAASGFVLAGHPGKLAKTIGGCFQTHYSKSPPAKDFVIEFLKEKLDAGLIRELEESPTVEGIIADLQRHDKGDLLNEVSDAIEEGVRRYLKTDRRIPVILFDMNRKLIGSSRTAAAWMGR